MEHNSNRFVLRTHSCALSGFLVLLTLLICQSRDVCALHQHRTLAVGRCKAACLQACTQYLDKHERNVAKTLRVFPIQIRSHCQRLTNFFYSKCENVCELTLPEDACFKMCQSQETDSQAVTMCQLGCRGISTNLRRRIGDCPAAGQPHDVQQSRDTRSGREGGAYASPCLQDEDCRRPRQKCCSNICLTPVFSQDIPPLVAPPRIMEQKKGRSFEMTWKNYKYLNYSNPVLFVLQVRTYFSPEFDPRFARSWRTLFMSTKRAAVLEDLTVGQWYQFRVAAVSPQGTRGFDLASPPVRLSQLPQAPSPPQHLTDGVWSIHASGRINIQVNWRAPEYTNVPVTDYKVTWVQDHGYVQPDGQSVEALTRYRQKVPGTQFYCYIEGLLPDQTYKMQVTALSKWGEKTLESTPNTVFLTTPKVAKVPDSSVQEITSDDTAEHLLTNEGQCHCDGTQHASAGLSISQPTFTRTGLQARLQLPTIATDLGAPSKKLPQRPLRVEWVPRVCIESNAGLPVQNQPEMSNNKNAKSGPVVGSQTRLLPAGSGASFLLTGLRFNCRYSVKLIPVMGVPPDTTGSPPPAVREPLVGCFCTPSCRETNMAFGVELPDHCKALGPTIPDQPRGIKFEEVNSPSGEVTYRVSWSADDDTSSDRSESKRELRYRVLWGPSKDEPVEQDLYGGSSGLVPRLDVSNAETKVLKENTTFILLRELAKDRLYIVRIQAVASYRGREHVSAPAVLYLATNNNARRRSSHHRYTGAYQSNSRSLSASLWTNTCLLAMLTLYLSSQSR